MTNEAANLPLVSIIIVNWNGKKWLAKCFDSLLQQTYKQYEIIVVDNASTDDSVEFVRTNYPDIQLVENTQNLGFAGGNNTGYRAAKGDYILLLNNDTYVEPEFLRRLLDGAKQLPDFGSIQPKLVLMDTPEKLDNVGSYWTDSTFLYHYGYGKDQSLEIYNTIQPFFSNKGAAMLLKREAVEHVGLFDDDFWCYYEETDLCHRLWLAGYKCWYFPHAKVYHAMGGTSLLFPNDYIQFHNFKNKLLSFIKNFQKRSLLRIIPVYLVLNVGLSFLWLIKGKPKHFVALYRAVLWNVRNLRRTIDKRKRIQRLRHVSDTDIFAAVKRNPAIGYYRRLINGTLGQYDD